MEGDELEMGREELRECIRAKVNCKELQLLLERRETHADKLLKLRESVAACEAIVKKLYSLLGWEYTDSDEEDTPSNEALSLSAHETVLPKSQSHSPADIGHNSLLPNSEANNNLSRDKDEKKFPRAVRIPLVALTRLPESMVRSLHPAISPKNYSEDERSSSSDSDNKGTPGDHSSSSISSISSLNSRPKKRIKIGPMPNEEIARSHERHKAATEPDSLSAASKGQTLPATTDEVTSVGTVSAFCLSSDEDTNSSTSVQEEEEEAVTVNMRVLARRRRLWWQRGKIVDKLRKENGKVKYKVSFEEKGKSLVSGHHIAFNNMPDVEQLFVGSRVVVQSKADQSHFYPGVIAELPSKKNKMRYLVFIDDHTPVYVLLPSLHLVCQPLENPLDDILDDGHRTFMNEYLNTWPYAPKMLYHQGQVVNAEFNGVQQECKVDEIDCSLMQVVFQEDQHKEWIYRGSIRLEHIIKLREQVELKKMEEQRSTPTSELAGS